MSQALRPLAQALASRRSPPRPRAYRSGLSRRELLVITGLALVTFVVTLSVLASRAAAGTRARAQALAREQQAAQKVPPLTTRELALSPDDFVLPAPPSPGTGYVPWRPRTPVWTEEMVKRYWVPPRQIAADTVGTLSDQAMERLFEKVP